MQGNAWMCQGIRTDVEGKASHLRLTKLEVSKV